MEISFLRFNLTPIRPFNSQEDTRKKEGVFLRGKLNNKMSYWEYTPHENLGDDPVDQFLANFLIQKNISAKKAFRVLTHPLELKADVSVQCHELWRQENKTEANIVKYKIMHKNDNDFLPLLESEKIIRLDANGLFSKHEWSEFESRIPEVLRKRIEYIEDPLKDLDWSLVHIPRASDFILGTPYEVKIHKPYREDYPQSEKVIFSAPMGHLLGSYLTYHELCAQGDTSLVHGLLTPDCYEEVPSLFIGNYSVGFRPNLSLLESFLTKLNMENWKVLCSI